MNTANSRILVLVEPPTAFIRCVGRAGAERARDFKQLVGRLESQGIRQVCLDLTECKLMDSTFSGVLAALATGPNPAVAPPPGCPEFVLVNPNERVRDLLDNLGVLPRVTVLEGQTSAAPATPAVELAPGSQSRDDVRDACLDAHRFLMALDPRNVPKFQELTRALEAEKAAGG